MDREDCLIEIAGGKVIHIGSSVDEFFGVEMSALATQVAGSHYKDCGIQPIEYIMANELNYCEANAVKYVTRHASKGGAQDVKKAIHYLRILLEKEYGIKSTFEVAGED